MINKNSSRRRKSIRLPIFDYSLASSYFVTIVTWHRKPIFGKIQSQIFQETSFGRIAKREWFRTTELRREITLRPNEFVVMPNHIHGIVWINEEETGFSVGAQRRCAPTTINPANQPLGVIIRAYKSAVTYHIHSQTGLPGPQIWQRNYYEHIIRNEEDYLSICKYIQENPLSWGTDEENEDY